MFVGLHDVRYAFMAVRVGVAVRIGIVDTGDGEEGTPLEQNDLLGLDLLGECLQELLNHHQIGDHLVDNASPSLVECLIPDAASKGLETHALGSGQDHSAALFVNSFAVFVLDQVHFVNETEDHGCGRVLLQGCDDCTIGVKVAIDFARLDIEDVDEHLGIAENVLALCVEVRVHESILPTTVSM